MTYIRAIAQHIQDSLKDVEKGSCFSQDPYKKIYACIIQQSEQ